jgi:hypothetical protein
MLGNDVVVEHGEPRSEPPATSETSPKGKFRSLIDPHGGCGKDSTFQSNGE